MNPLLPESFDALVSQAIDAFWSSRDAHAVTRSQGGSRDKVVAGRNMNGFIDLVSAVVEHCGYPDCCVHQRRASVVLPGFFRATKDWDAVIIHRRRLLAVFEFKSQVGSFGNNLNNRSEEAIGSAADFWVAHHFGAYGARRDQTTDGVREEAPALLNPSYQADPRPPFLAWLMLLEDCAESQRPVGCREPHFPVFSEFRDASYARRYQILCERLVERRLYSAAALELTPTNQPVSRSLSPATSIRNLFAEFAGRLLAAREVDQGAFE